MMKRIDRWAEYQIPPSVCFFFQEDACQAQNWQKRHGNAAHPRPFLLIVPLFALLGAGISVLTVRSAERHTVVERLREE